MLKNIRLYALAAIGLTCMLPAMARAQSAVRGGVYELERRSAAIAGASVVNISSGARTQSDLRGQFTIAAKKGDRLAFYKEPFRGDTIFLADLDTKIVYMSLNATNLREVKIQGANVSKATTNVNTTTGNKTGLYTRGLDGVPNNGSAGGLVFGLGDAKARRERDRLNQFEQRDAFVQEIKRNFNEVTIHQQLGLKGDELKRFIDTYFPDASEVARQRPFNYTQYITLSFNNWVKRGRR